MGSVSDGDPSQGLQTYTPVEFTEAEGYRLTKELLVQPRRATAIICSDHLMALGVLQAIDEAGLRIPEDLSVISWNNVLLERTPVSITSVCFDRKDAGARFCKRVIECIEHPDRHFEPEYLRPQLVIRQSTGAPASDGSR
jgi:LacI family transcriptional regulator